MKIISLIHALVLVFGIYGCKSKDVRQIKIGNSVEVASETIPLSGGDLVIDKPGSPVHGLKISVPAGSYDQEQNFRISYAPIEDNALATGFHILTPLISIDNNGAFSEAVIIVTIPVKVSANKFAMPFIYDKETGYLEGLPILSVDNDQITFATRHFSEVVVTETDKEIINKPYETEFKPRADDWQMGNPPNVKKSIGGQCSGQSIGMMWYFNEKRKNGEQQLYGRYDSGTPGFWQDDTLALKLCALLQHEDANHGFGNASVDKYIKEQQSKEDVKTVLQFAAAFSANKPSQRKPQFLLLNREGSDAGHAVVVHKMENGTLFIADPNVPGESKTIKFNRTTNKYEPYTSKSNVYTKFSYLGEFALLPGRRVAELWSKLQNATIGEGEFPKYELKIKVGDGHMEPLTDGLKVPKKTTITAYANETLNTVIYDSRFQALKWDGSTIELPPGKQKIGIEVREDVEWVGFKWINVDVEKDDIPDLSGTWLFRNIAGQICTISQTGKELKLTTEKGVSGTGVFQDNSTIIVDFPFAPGLIGTITNNGNRINWSNGERWERSP